MKSVFFVDIPIRKLDQKDTMAGLLNLLERCSQGMPCDIVQLTNQHATSL